MSHDPTVARRQVEMTNSLGLHMRPANKFVELALQFQSEIRVHYNGNEYNGKSILELTLSRRRVRRPPRARSSGPDASAAIDALADLVKAQFHEEDEVKLRVLRVTKEVPFFSICTNDSIPDTLVIDRTYQTGAGFMTAATVLR